MMVHVYVDENNFRWYLDGRLFEAHTKELKKPKDIHISVPSEWVMDYRATEDGVWFIMDPKRKDLEIDFSPLLGEIYITHRGKIARYHPSEFGLTTDDLVNMSEDELKNYIEKKWRNMR